MANEAADEANTDRSNFCGPTEGRPKCATARDKMKFLDIRGDMEALRQESLCAPRPKEGAGVSTADWESGNGELGGRPKTEGGQSGGRVGGAGGGGSTPHPVGVVPHTGVVQGCSRPRSAARSSYARADNSREGHAVQPCPAPRRQHTSGSRTVRG